MHDDEGPKTVMTILQSVTVKAEGEMRTSRLMRDNDLLLFERV